MYPIDCNVSGFSFFKGINVKAFRKNRVDKAIQLAEHPTCCVLHWYSDTNGNVVKRFTQIKPYQTLIKKDEYEHDNHRNTRSRLYHIPHARRP